MVHNFVRSSLYTNHYWDKFICSNCSMYKLISSGDNYIFYRGEIIRYFMPRNNGSSFGEKYAFIINSNILYQIRLSLSRLDIRENLITSYKMYDKEIFDESELPRCADVIIREVLE